MELVLIHREEKEDYLVLDRKNELGCLYKADDPEWGSFWVFSVLASGIFGRSAYFYSSLETALDRIPLEIRNKISEAELYMQTTTHLV